MDAKIGRPLGLAGGLTEEVDSPIYATGVGLVLHALRTGDRNEPLTGSAKEKSVELVMHKLTDRMKSWFKEF